jgi:hypothetical protein
VLTLVATNLTRHAGRTIATAIGIALGVGTIVALLSIGAGLKAARGSARELHRALDGLGPAVGAHDGVDRSRGAREQLLGQHPLEQGHAQLRQIGRPGLEHAADGVGDLRVVATHREHPVAAEEIEVAVAVLVDQVGALAVHPAAVEAQRAHDPPSWGSGGRR